MRIMTVLAGLTLLLLIGASSPDRAAESPAKAWLCIGEQAVGFARAGPGPLWTETRFATGKYVVSQASGKDPLGKRIYWKVRAEGEPESSVLAYCRVDFDEKIGDTKCDQFNGDFLFNRLTLRFTRISATAGYINNDAPGVGGALPPTLEIGTCSAMH